MSRKYGFLLGMAVALMALMVNDGYAISLAGLEHDHGSILVGNKLFERFEVNSVDNVGRSIVNGLHIIVTPFINGSKEGLAFDGLIQANCQLTSPNCLDDGTGRSSSIDMFFTYDIRTTNEASLSDFGMTFNGASLGGGSSAQIIETARIGEIVTVSAPSTLSDYDDFVLNSGDIARIKTRIILIAGSDPNGFASVSHFTQDFSSPPVIPEVPEPGTWLLFITGIAGLAGYQWYRRRA